MNLPLEYLNNMKTLLQDEYDQYLDSFNRQRIYGLRVNTLKISVEDFLKISPFTLKPIPWCKDGFYCLEEEKPSKHPYYYAGLYYLQEPSAMVPAEVLDIEENDLVLDACSAPGGKATKLACKLKGTGVIVSNDISTSRQQVTLKNIENFGISNAYIISEDISKLKNNFQNSFDKILVDAPCSGEGMFRKEPALIKSWLERGNDYYASIQKQIIKDALDLLKDGGKLVYSTCTFSKKEDEDIIEYALSICPNLKVLPINSSDGFTSGLTDKTKNCVRLYPHKIDGEGHFVALLQKGDNKSNNEVINHSTNINLDFFKNINKPFINYQLINRENKYYLEPISSLNFKGLRVLRSGLYLGEYKHDKFEPSISLALNLKTNEFNNILNLSLEDPRVIKYLKCETLDVKEYGLDGYVLVCVNNFPLGFGIVNKGTLKNKYPSNYRYQ